MARCPSLMVHISILLPTLDSVWTVLTPVSELRIFLHLAGPTAKQVLVVLVVLEVPRADRGTRRDVVNKSSVV